MIVLVRMWNMNASNFEGILSEKFLIENMEVLARSNSPGNDKKKGIMWKTIVATRGSLWESRAEEMASFGQSARPCGVGCDNS
jgi:hypothetical protein